MMRLDLFESFCNNIFLQKLNLLQESLFVCAYVYVLSMRSLQSALQSA